MITQQDLINKRWTYCSRTLINNFSSTIEHLGERIKLSKKLLDKATTTVDKYIITEGSKLFELWTEKLEVSSSESDVILNFARYLMVAEFENAKMGLHITYVYQENLWLRAEMFDLHKLLLKLERMCLAAEAEKKFLQNYYNMRNYTKASGKIVSIAAQTDANMEEEDTEPEEDIPTSLTSLFHMVTQFIAENRHGVATSWCTKSLVDFKKKFGEVSREVGAVYNLLGRIYKSYGAFALARDNFELALTIREKVHGKDSDPVGITLTLLGSTLGKLKNYKKGLETCKNALVIRENIFGKNNEVAHIYGKIADFSFQLKQWNECVNNYKICLAVFDKIYDITEYTMIKGYTTLSHAYINTNTMDMALECLTKVNLAYTRKNNPGTSKVNTPIMFIEESLKRNVTDFSAEMMTQKFGTISDTLDDRVTDIMCLYYEKTGKTEVVEMLKGWVDLSNRDMNTDDNKISTFGHIQRKLSLSSFKKSPGDKGRKESISSSVKQGIKSMFKGKK